MTWILITDMDVNDLMICCCRWCCQGCWLFRFCNRSAKRTFILFKRTSRDAVTQIDGLALVINSVKCLLQCMVYSILSRLKKRDMLVLFGRDLVFREILIAANKNLIKDVGMWKLMRCFNQKGDVLNSCCELWSNKHAHFLWWPN